MSPQRKKLILAAGALLLAIAVAVALVVYFDDSNRPAGGDAAVLTPSHLIAIEVENYGTITAALYADAAPITVENFMKLVDEGFYNGLTFHRIISGFMVQGGDPTGTGMGGSDTPIKGEFAQNGYNNPIKPERGVLSMARTNDPDSASSQFFIMHQASPGLDGAYAAFGKVLDGIEIVDAICADTPVVDNNGTVVAENQPVITSIRRVENQ